MPRLKADTVNPYDFMCRCGKREAARCDRILAEAKRLISWPDRVIDRYRDDTHEMDYMLYTLSSEGTVAIIADQWARVSFEPWGNEKYPAEYEGCSIQCDSIVDGIAAAFLFLSRQDARTPL